MKVLSGIVLIGVFFFIVLIFAEDIQADWTYSVHRGDTIYNIAERTGVSASDLRQHNSYSGDALKIGQKLIIPSSPQDTPAETSGDVELLARVINAEAANEPYAGKVAVGSVIMNRIEDPKFPKTIGGVVYQPHAFESVSNGMINRPVSEESVKAARDAINGWDPSGGAKYFYNPAKTYSPWIWNRPVINRIGRHVFAK